MKNLPITWRLNLGLAIFAALGLAGAILTWWIGKENEAARGRGIQRQLQVFRLTRQLAHDVESRANHLRRFLFSPAPGDLNETRAALQEAVSFDSTLGELRNDTELQTSLDALRHRLHPGVRAAEDRLLAAATRDLDAARQLYWEDYHTARVLLADGLKDLETRIASRQSKPHPALLTVETALVIVLVFFAAWTFALLRHNLVAFKEPVLELRAALDRLARGDFSINVHLKRKDEFADIANGIINTTRSLAVSIGRVHQNAQIVARASETLVTAATQQQRAVEEIESIAEFISDAGRNIHYTATQLAGAVNIVGQAAESASRLGTKGNNVVNSLNEAMIAIKDSSDGISNKLEVLNEKATNVGQVVVTMSKVADQTNLLSINAAIEAEKAGESGKGFAVVANEIQRLADQTAVAAEDIEQMVKEMRTAVAAGVIGTEQFGIDVRGGAETLGQLNNTVTGISRQIGALQPQVDIVSNSMHSQTDGARQLQSRGQALSRAMKAASESLHAIKAATEQLESATVQLEEGMVRFKFPD